MWRLGAITDRYSIRKAYGFTPMPLSEGLRYVLPSDGPPGRRKGPRERAATPDPAAER